MKENQMSNESLIPTQQRKADAEIRAALAELKDHTRALLDKIEQATESLYAGKFDADEHETLRYETSKLKLIYAGFDVAVKHIESCQDTVALVFKRIYALEERNSPKFWWSKFVWLGATIRWIAGTITAIIVIMALLKVPGVTE
jgi:hypothetical protein